MAQAYLLREGLKGTILSADNTQDKIQEKALADIILICKYDTANHIQACTNSFKAWKILKDLYNANGFTSKYLLLQQFFQASQSDFKSVEAYISKLKSILDNLAAQELVMPEIAIIAYLLQNLNSKYNAFVSQVTQSLRVDPKAYN